MRASLNEDKAVVGHTVHTASAVDSATDCGVDRLCHCRTGTGIGVAQIHQTAYIIICVAIGRHCLASHHGTLVATAVDGVHLTIEQYDVGDNGKVAHIVAAEDGAHMVVSLRSHSGSITVDIEQHGDAAGDGDAVAAAIDRFDMAAVVRTVGICFEAVDVDVDKGVGLDRLVGDIAVLHISSRTRVYIGTVAAAIDDIDIRSACDFDVGVHSQSCQRSLFVGSDIIATGQCAVGNLGDLAGAVVAAIEGTVDGATRNLDFVAAVDGCHIATAIDAAVHDAAIHTNRGEADKGTELVVVFRTLLVDESNGSHVTTGIDIAIDFHIATHHHVGLVMGGD